MPTHSAVVTPPSPSLELSRVAGSTPIPKTLILPLDARAYTQVVINGTAMRALIDTGASDSYLDTRHTEKFAEVVRRYPKAIPLRMFDGSSSVDGMLMHYLDAELTVPSSSTDCEPLSVPIRLSITRLCDADIVIGTKWITREKAIIDLARGELTLGCPTSSERNAPSSSLLVIEPSSSSLSLEPSPEPSAPSYSPEPSAPSPSEAYPVVETAAAVVTEATPQLAYAQRSWRGRKSVRQGRNRRERQARLPASKEALTYPNNIELQENRYEKKASSEEEVSGVNPMFALLRAIVDLKIEEVPEIARSVATLSEIVPVTYHEYLDLFDPTKAKEELPPTRGYDMRIKLKDGARLEPAKLYRLSGAEKEAMQALLRREVACGRIRRCGRPYGSPAFMVPKTNGEYRMVIDYRVINSHTVSDAYPLPLISSLLDTLSAAKFYTRLDLPGAYQLLRMAEGHEEYTAFRTEFGMFESLVVRDGLKNAPAVFQYFLNDVLQELLGCGVVIYIDDIVIYADTLEELRRRTLRVFELLRNAGLFVKAEKCEFEKDEIKFLGFIVSHKGVRADPEKVDAIRSFPAPEDLPGARSFVGLASYYRRFVKNFSDIVRPITMLTKKEERFRWGEQQDAAFETVKSILSSAPVIRTFDPTKEAIIQTDASYYGWGFVVSQWCEDDGLEHPVFIESGRFTDTETRYSTSEKEFFAILMAFRRTKHLLLQVHSRVVTDHQNLKYWMKLQQLSHRQVRWANELAPFNFTIEYRPGRYADVPDALSRRGDYHLGKGSTTSLSTNFGQALPTFGEEHAASMADLAAVVPNERLSHLDDAEILEGLEVDPFIEEMVEEMKAVVCAKCDHPTCRTSPNHGDVIEGLRRSTRNDAYSVPTWSTAGFLLFNGRIYVPEHHDLRSRLLYMRHTSLMAGHPGGTKTRELVERDYIWPGLASDARKFVDGCATCLRSKPRHHAPYGMLRTLEVATRPWEEISMDFVEPLPKSNGYDSVLVVVDRLTKWAVFVPAKTTWKAPHLATAFFDAIASQHGLPSAILSDRGSKFTSIFWRALSRRLDMRLRLSTSYQPQTDGQTERTNQALEHYLRIHCEYQQKDWSSLLGLASFAYNNTVHTATRMTPFYANYGYHPRWAEETESTVPDRRVASRINEVHAECARNIVAANESYAKFYDKYRESPPKYEVGDKVLLSMKDVTTKRPMKKLDWKYTGPYTITEKVSSHAFRLELPASAKIHDVFHISRLEPWRTNNIGDNSPPEPIEVEGHKEYEVESIVGERWTGRGRGRHKEYLVKWTGYEGTGEETSWTHEKELEDTEALDDWEAERRLL